jgi:DNA repair exonuclease SbcCD ATPase subunit
MARNAIAHKYSGAPEKLLEASDAEKEFIAKDPKLQMLVDKLNNAKKYETETKRIATERQTESKRINEAFANISKQQKLRADAKKEIRQHAAKIESLKSERKKLIEATERKARMDENATAEKEKLKEVEKELKDTREKRRLALKIVGGVVGVQKGMGILSKILTGL